MEKLRENLAVNKNHHALTMEASAQLLQFWPAAGNTARYAKAAHEISDLSQLNRMMRWVVQPDELDDVITDCILVPGFRPTSFQHFAYCGSLGPLTGGNTVVNKFEGYCWDCDPFISWREPLPDACSAGVRFRPDPSIPGEIMEGHPASKMLQGMTDWDDQQYPSALDLAEFYGERSLALKARGKTDDALQSLCFAIHMLHDLTIPQHVLCTIENGHAAYERESDCFWQNIFASRSPSYRISIFNRRLSGDILGALSEVGDINLFRRLGEYTAERTRKSLITSRKDVSAPCKDDAYRLTSLGIVCTIKALEIFASTS